MWHLGGLTNAMVYVNRIYLKLIMKRICFFAIAAAVMLTGCVNNGSNQKVATDISEAEPVIMVNDTLSRDEFVKLDVESQHSVFVTLSPAKKIELYQYKFNKDLASNSLSDREKELLKSLLDNASVKIYEPGEERDAFKALGTEVEKKLREECGWDDGKCFQYLETLLTAEEIAPHIEAKRQQAAE